MNNATRHAKGQTIAVVGGGVAGIVAAYLLQQHHQVTLFEQNDYLGGHTHTIEITDGADAGTAVDTGFIVLNDATYPLLQKFLAHLGVETRVSDMSFGFQCHQTGLVYAGTDVNGLFAQRCNLVNPKFFHFIFEIARFCRQALQDLEQDAVPRVSLGEYLQSGRFSAYMVDNYLVPMAAAIWSTPALRVVDFPAGPFLYFFRNHGLLSMRNRPLWRTVVGGSDSYVKAFSKNFRGQLQLSAPVRSIQREDQQVELTLDDGSTFKCDQVVIACHADQAIRLLESPTELEQRLLSPWRYQKNHTVLHTDCSVLPKLKRAWASWNFTREPGGDAEHPVYVTYYMNRLQGLKADRDYCVTLNRREPFSAEQVVAAMDYHHPLYTHESMATQEDLPQLNGQNRTYFCGSYFGYGFHEDAVRAGNEVGKAFGVSL
ncbi:MAG: FAD-dependent oxidoreductase [Desulfuromonadales bacterium]